MTSSDYTIQYGTTSPARKIKKRGFVMTGGGAKGLYEAGVIHAFHITGMEFDVITGSSIGAMNSVFFAEYLFKKAELKRSGEGRTTDDLVKALNAFVQSYHHAWLMMPAAKIIDDSEEGPIGRLKDDFTHYSVNLPWIAKAAWWWTDPNRGIPSPAVAFGLSKLLAEVALRHGGDLILDTMRTDRRLSVNGLARSYFRKMNIEKALVPDTQKLKNLFIHAVTPLTEDHLTEDVNDQPGHGQVYSPLVLVDPDRTLKDYADQGIMVRLTRANYRTGRLEISQYVTVEDFVRFLDKFHWLPKKPGPDKIPLGSFRLQVPGNPNAVNAGLCSGRFPGVFAPFPIEEIYPETEENRVLYKMLNHWINDPYVEEELCQAYKKVRPKGDFKKLQSAWSDDPQEDSSFIDEFFPKAGDLYVDGGSIDNTPSNSAVDYLRDWVDKQDGDHDMDSRRAYQLELYVIYLSTEPKMDVETVLDPTIFDVVKRTLEIQGIASRTSDANTVDIINTFGDRAEIVAQMLLVVMENYREILMSMSLEKRCEAMEKLSSLIIEHDLEQMDAWLRLPKDDLVEDGKPVLLDRIARWNEKMIKHRLPVQVEVVKVYPDEMPLDTLQFTDRLQYKKSNAIKMLWMGCADTLWAIRARLEKEAANQRLDDLDKDVLRLTRKWMGESQWIDLETLSPEEIYRRRGAWKCQREKDCVFYDHYCKHGLTSQLS